MKTNLKAALATSAAVLGASWASNAVADLTPSYQFVGNGNWSIDGVGSNNTPVGIIQAVVPVGSMIEQAFLYSSGTPGGSGAPPTVDFDGTVYSGADWLPLGINTSGLGLQAFRTDVTAQVAAKVGGGGGAPFDFSVNSEIVNGSIDGEVLAVVYSNPAEAERTIAFLDGFSQSNGDSFTVNLDQPLDTSPAGFEALLSLGIGFSASQQGAPQTSLVDVNGRRLTSSAGSEDDGALANGALITVGGLGDDPGNPDDPNFQTISDPRYDDELYNLAAGNVMDPTPYLLDGITEIDVLTQNPSDDDNIFFAGFNITAVADVVVDPDPDPAPLPTSLVLLGLGFAGLGLMARRRAA